MKRKILNFNYLKKEKGSAMMVVLLILVVVPVLGMALLSATSSNFKLTGREREFQSVYYVAEAGINHVMYDIRKKVDELSEETFSHEEFFEELDKFINEELNSVTLDDFNKNFGESPRAKIFISAGDINDENTSDYSERVKGYTISSEGEIGRLSRTVSTSIEIVHTIETGTEPSRHPVFDYIMYSGSESILTISSGAIVKGDVYGYKVDCGHSNSTVEGDIISLTDIELAHGTTVVGTLYACGFFNTNGDVTLKASDCTVEKDIHANGNVTIHHNGAVNGDVFSNKSIEMKSLNARVMGNVHANSNVTMGSSCIINKNVYLLGELNRSGSSIIKGDVFNDGIIKPEFPIIDKISPPNLMSFDVGIDNIKLEENWKNPNVQPVLPGHYNNLEINYGNTIGFSSGDYYFRNIEAGNSAIKIKYDLFNGPINIYVKEHIEFGGTLEVFASKDGENYTKIDSNLWDNNSSLAIELAGKVYWETHDNFKMAENCCFLGTILSKGDITTVSGAEIIGSYCTTDGLINIAQNSKIMYAPPTYSVAGNSENNGGTGNGNGNDEGQNITCRIDIISPIREK